MRMMTASRDGLAQAAQVLRDGGVVAYPTDTLYGLAVDPRNASAVERLFVLKGRHASVAIPLIAATVEQAQTAGELSPAHLQLARAFWPGPLTIVVPAKASIARLLLGGGSTIAVRIPAHAVATGLAAALDGCITSTSANRSGQPAATNAQQVSSDLGDAIDMVLDGGPSPGGAPSTIVEVVDGRVRLVRAGAVSWDRVLESLK
jgi:L-threonylcarbamoyladenylate synthase